MIKRLSLLSTLLFLVLGLGLTAQENMRSETSIGFHAQDLDLDTAELDFGDEELSATLLNKANAGCHKHHRRHHHVYDYIIIGNGTAGATLARKLSDGNKNKVLVIEAGSNRAEDPVVNTAAFDLNAITYNPKYAVTYTTPPFTPAGQLFTYTEGRMWGGGSGHHYLNYVRGTPEIYDAWAAASGNSQW